MKYLSSFAFTIMMVCTSCAVQKNDQVYTTSSTITIPKGTVDQQIAQLEEQKRIYLLRAKYFQDEADRVFTQDWLAYKQCLAQQQRYQNLANQADEVIKMLQAEKR